MVDKFIQILRTLEAEKGTMVFFGIFKMDEITEKWTVIVSANWATEGSLEDFRYVLDKIKLVLTHEELATIARIGVYSCKEHLIDLLLNFTPGSRIQEQQVNGNLIHDGYVLASDRNIEAEVVPI